LLLFGAAQAEVIVLQHSDRHPYGAGRVVYDIAAGNDLRKVFAHRLANFLVVSQPVARAARKQVVPLRGIGAGVTASAARTRPNAGARIGARGHGYNVYSSRELRATALSARSAAISRLVRVVAGQRESCAQRMEIA